MQGDSSSEKDPDDNDRKFSEIDPSGRYGRYQEVLGKGAFKTVYKAFDEFEGIEVAWNQVKVVDVLRYSEDLEGLYSEVHLLQTLNHKNIIKLYNSWVDVKDDNINFITEVFTSGTLHQYRKKHKRVNLRALKNWSKQILEGLLYLHSHDPPVIHRDLKCDNIFVNGNHGDVKIGDLGLAAILHQANSAHGVIGTPEFMAPELYEEEYNELVDIYAFGMCLLELVTLEYPYVECTNAAQIYKKVTAGIKPLSLGKVKDPGIRVFIEKCIANVSERLSARELLNDPFLQSDGKNESVHSLLADLDCSDDRFDGRSDSYTSSSSIKDHFRVPNQDFTVEGQRQDNKTIFLKLRIADSKGHVRNIHFPFDIEADTAISVASEMVTELDLTDQDVTAIAAMIDLEIQALVPEWIPGEAFEENFEDGREASSNCEPETKVEFSDLISEASHPIGNLVLERLPSGRLYWSDSPRMASEHSPSAPYQSNLSSDVVSHVSDDPSEVLSRVSDDLSTEACELAVSPKAYNSREYLNGVASPNQQIESASLMGGTEDNGASPDHSEIQKTSPHDEVHKGEISACADLQNCKHIEAITDHHASDGGSFSLEENHRVLMDDEQEDVKVIAEKLEYLLLDQQKELDELKREHEQAVADLLKQLPPELRCRTLNICHLKTADCRAPSEVRWYPGQSSDSNSSLPPEALSSHMSNFPAIKISEDPLVAAVADNVSPSKKPAESVGSSKVFHIIRKVGKLEGIFKSRIVGPASRDQLSFVKEDGTSSDTGIAMILGDVPNTIGDVPNTSQMRETQ